MKGHIKGTDCMQLNKTKQKRREKKSTLLLISKGKIKKICFGMIPRRP